MTRIQGLGIVLAGALLTTLVSGGCGSSDDVVDVTGTVKLDGEPLSNAIVIFQPEGEGVPSFGKTDETGKYSLTYRNGVPGAPPGKYIVSITTFSEGDPDADPPEPKSPEKVPARYNQETELTEEVTPGENTINFDLEGGGNILEPPDPNAMDDG